MRRLPLIPRLAAIAALLVGGAGSSAWAQGGTSVPPLSYYAAQGELYAGDYTAAVKDFTAETRGAIKTAASSWIDSICYRAMLGESYYHLGQYPQAIENYNAALQLFSAYSDWMLRVQFTPNIAPDPSRARRAIPWGQSTRQFKLGRVPDTLPIAQGQVDNNAVVQQGGVVQKAILFPINVQEIVRCTALALRRRAELMGPICKHDPLTGEILAKLSRRPGPRGHWSEAWIDLQLGLAQVGAGELAQAQQSLTRAIVMAGEYDHALSGVAMLELGRIALLAGDFKAAERLLAEAGYSAVYYDDYAVLDESLRLGLEAHLRGNQPGVYPPLVPAFRWSRTSRLRHVQAWIGVLTAENYAVLNQTNQAFSALNEAKGLMVRGDMGRGVVGARANYIAALVAYQRGRPDEAQEALGAALAFQRNGSRWLYQISLADHLYTSGAVTPRNAMDLYREVLRDPAAADWSSQPFESISVLALAHEGSYENWFEVALQRKELNTALEIADRTRRHRFFTSLPRWGRDLALRKILATPAAELPQAVALQRQDLLVRYPQYDQLAQQAAGLQTKLHAAPLAPDGDEALREQSETLAALAKVSAAQDALIQQMALRREPADMVFPPVRTTAEVQESLGPGQMALVFFQTRRGLYGFLVAKERYAGWRVQSGAALQKSLGVFLRDLGQYDQNRQLDVEEVQSAAWRKSAASMMQAIFAESKIDLSRGIEELIIVPDGMMWYVPFEALLLGASDDAPTLLSRVRVRYAPTFALAMPDRTPRKRGGNLGVVVGKLFPNDKETVATAAFEKLQGSVPEATRLPSPLPATANIYRAIVDRLVVFDDTPVDPAAPYGWVPINLDRRAAAPLASWFPLPWGYPDQIVLPGFHTAAEHGLKKKMDARPGNEVFLSACALMAGGSRTVLLSRWRPGGETSVELVQQFVQELPFTTAADAWQRAVELVKESSLNWEQEPRLKRFDADPPTAQHPFFWAGYILLDTGATPRDDDAAPAADPAPPALDFQKLKEKQAAEAAPHAVPAPQNPAPADPPANPAATPAAPKGFQRLKDQPPTGKK